MSTTRGIYYGLSNENHPAIIELKKRVSEQHLLVTNSLRSMVFNGQTKRQAGSHRLGFSSNVDQVNKWIKTANIHAKLREKFNASINLNTSNEHNESTYGAKEMHRKHVEALKKSLAHIRLTHSAREMHVIYQQVKK